MFDLDDIGMGLSYSILTCPILFIIFIITTLSLGNVTIEGLNLQSFIAGAIVWTLLQALIGNILCNIDRKIH